MSRHRDWLLGKHMGSAPAGRLPPPALFGKAGSQQTPSAVPPPLMRSSSQLPSRKRPRCLSDQTGSTATEQTRSVRALASRRDAPLVMVPSSASRSDAFAAGSTQSARADALEAYVRDKRSMSSQGSDESNFEFWCDLHRNWFGQNSEPLPITPESLAAVASQFKAGRFKSYAGIKQHRYRKFALETPSDDGDENITGMFTNCLTE